VSRGELLGRSGILRRYRVAVEAGAGENVEEFGTAVDRTLANPASWIGSGQLRLQRVPGSAPYDFTVYLATAGTARVLCATGGVDIMVGTRPYTSCRALGRVIVNLDRWRLSVEHFVAARVPLDTYRSYVINHEVGHELGYGHESCPGKRRPAPVMTQQTLFLTGCVANAWPYLGREAIYRAARIGAARVSPHGREAVSRATMARHTIVNPRGVHRVTAPARRTRSRADR
jgi:hypothetical protein